MQRLRKVGYTYYTEGFGCLLVATLLRPGVKGRPESARISLIDSFTRRGGDATHLTQRGYRTILLASQEVLSLPCVARYRGRLLDYMREHGGLKVLRHDGAYKVLMNLMGQPRHGASVRKYADCTGEIEKKIRGASDRTHVVHTHHVAGSDDWSRGRI